MSAYESNPWAIPEPRVNHDEPSSDSSSLPIDLFRRKIINQIGLERVTIIHGETGCGKSSRVPIFLLDTPSQLPVKFMVAQPRRIACKGLLDRMKSSHPHRAEEFAMRLGHGLREEERGKARCWFCTTGYLVRLLANHPSYFDSHSHLIIDEVHERSVDGDLLCLLAKRLLDTNPRIKLVLMSATLAASSYQEYFNLPSPPIHIKVRKHSITTRFADDLLNLLPDTYSVDKLLNLGNKCSVDFPPRRGFAQLQYGLAVEIAKTICSSSSSVLIFVSGMADITEIMEIFDRLETTQVFNCIPIHGDLPFEEQFKAFEAPVVGESKIVIATNAAESSITLPDVDHVIDLGMHKQIQYNEKTHRQVLAPTFICKSSAKQRAGRTGRVRPGYVYRLYSREFYEYEMREFDKGEILRTPLDNVILDLKEIMNDEEVIPILEDLIEPPSTANIASSFTQLHKNGLLTNPGDESKLTKMGSFVCSLGLGIDLGRFVGLSAQMGMLNEAIYIAAAMNCPRPPFKMANPLVHTDCDVYNKLMTDTFVSKFELDNGVDSEIFQVFGAMLRWEKEVSHSEEGESSALSPDKFCRKYSVAFNRMSPLMQTKKNLQERISLILKVDRGKLEIKEWDTFEGRAETGKLKLLKVILVWVFVENVMKSQAPKKKSLDQLRKMVKMEEGGEFSMALTVREATEPLTTVLLAPILNRPEIKYDLTSTFQRQFTGYSTVEGGNGGEIHMKEVEAELLGRAEAVKDHLHEKGVEIVIVSIKVYIGDELDGSLGDSDEESYDEYGDEYLDDYGESSRHCYEYVAVYAKDGEELLYKSMNSDGLESAKSIASQKASKRAIVKISNSQTILNVITDDVNVTVKKNDLFRVLSGDNNNYFQVRNLGEQVLESNQELRFKGDTLRAATLGPLMMHQLQAGRRKDASIILKAEKGGNDIKFKIAFPSSSLSFLDSTDRSFLTDNSKVVAKLGLWETPVYAVAVSRLDIATGGNKAEGISILPPGEWFVQKCFLTFGLDHLLSSMWNEEGGSDDIVQMCEVFDLDCEGLGENLVCKPEVIKQLCEIFGVDEWDLSDNACVDQEEDVDEDLEEVLEVPTPGEGW